VTVDTTVRTVRRDHLRRKTVYVCGSYVRPQRSRRWAFVLLAVVTVGLLVWAGAA
jgi:hypothetical protein